MKSVIFFLTVFFTFFAQAQIVYNPAPSSGMIQLTSSTTNISVTNQGSLAVSVSFSVASNSDGVAISLNRCGASIAAKATCQISISFSNYGKAPSLVSVDLKNGSSSIATLTYQPINPPPETSNFSVSSLVMNDFLNYTISITNKTSTTKSYSPTFSGTDNYRYAIGLNRCVNVAPKATCQVVIKLNRQFAGSYSASLVEAQVTGSIALTSLITNLTVGVIPPPNPSISVSPSSISFGTLTRLGQSASQIATITNNGNTNLTPVVSVQGSGLAISLNRCLVLLSPGQSCTVSLYFNALNVMQNGVQSGLVFNAQATNSSSVIPTSVSVTLNIPPSLLVSVPESTTNPPYLSGVLALGAYKSARLSPSGDLYTTGGGNNYGSLYSSFSLDMDLFPSGEKFKYISMSKNSDYFCGISLTNVTYCTDPYGDPGDIYSPDMSGLGGQYFKEVHTGFVEVDLCGLTNTNNVYCWGSNDFGQRGDGSAYTTGFGFSNIPHQISMSGALSGKTIKKLVSSVLNKCVLASDDQVYCWGYGNQGSLGNGSNSNSNVPVAISMTGPLAGKTVKDIAAGANSYCIVASDDKIYCWGLATADILNHVGDVSVPTVLPDPNNILSGKKINKLSVGLQQGCFIADDNKIYCFGLNDRGQLGNGTIGGSKSLVAVDMLNFAGKTPNDISVGSWSACSSTTDGSLFCWGGNDDSQLGISGGDRSSPVSVPNGF